MAKDFLEVVKDRRSIRHYLKKEVENELIEKIISAGIWAPTTCNQQLWNFIVIKEDSTKQRLIKEASSTTLISRAPAIIILTYEKANYKEAVQGATAAMENILLAANYYGIGACSINSFGNEKKIKKILHIPKDQLVVCFITLGYTDHSFYKDLPPPPRRPIEKLVHYEEFKEKHKNVFSYIPDNWTMEDIKQYQRYYCRKTFLGKEMDIITPEEKEIAKRYLKDVKGPILDWFTYDGMYLPLFSGEEIHAVDLTDETSRYTKAAAENAKQKKMSFHIYDDSIASLRKKKFKTITAVYKFERIPKKFLSSVLKDSKTMLQDDGELLIIFRKKGILYRLFYVTLRLLFKDDIRNTGIYAFFGPYVPLHSKKMAKMLKAHGFKTVTKECYFPFPTFFDQAYQMVLQYMKSGGTSYLHRNRRENMMTKLIRMLINIYGFKETRFGTVCVIKAKK